MKIKNKFAGILTGTMCLSAIGPSCSAQQEKLADKPNVILIYADDLGSRLGCSGDAMAITPNIDRLAASGVYFSNTYCQLPTCGPSRASMLTGLYPWQTGVYGNDSFRDHIPDVVTLPQLLREKGYFTARVGKIYHMGIPAGIGTPGHDDPFSWDLTVNNTGWDAKKGNLKKVHRIADKSLGIVPAWLAPGIEDAEMADGQGTLDAIRLMETFHPDKTGKPLMLAVGYYRPHPPMVAPKKYFDKYPTDSINLPIIPENDRKDIPEVAFALKGDAFNFISESDGKHYTQAYYAAVSFMDAQVGLLIDALKKNGLYDNSIILFVGDQGFHLGEHGHWHKTTLFEEGTKVPLIIAGKAVKNTGSISNAMTELVDVYPTLTDMLGMENPHEMPGKSLSASLTGDSEMGETVALTAVRQASGISMRTERYRLTSWTIDGEKVYELYDHNTDPHEWNNLASNQEYAETLNSLIYLLNQEYNPVIPFKP